MDRQKVFDDALQFVDELHLTWHENMLITCNADGSIPLNSQVVCDIDLSKLSPEWQRMVRALIVSAPEMARAVSEDIRRTGRIGDKAMVALDKFSSALVSTP